MFYGEDVFKKISMLSGGEKVRLQLCKILKKGPNLLILDEPTNHMDIIGKESLELLLKEYNGTILFVSHDRFFVNKIADSLLVFSKDGVKFFDGNYEKYEESLLENCNNIEKNENNSYDSKNKYNNCNEKIVNNSYLLQKEKNRASTRIKKIERDLELLEQKSKDLNLQLTNEEIYSDYEKLTMIQNEIEEINNQINQYMEEWEKLQTFIEK